MGGGGGGMGHGGGGWGGGMGHGGGGWGGGMGRMSHEGFGFRNGGHMGRDFDRDHHRRFVAVPFFFGDGYYDDYYYGDDYTCFWRYGRRICRYIGY